MSIQKNGNAPYAPSGTVLELIDRFRRHGLQTPFTTDVLLRAGVTESLAPRTLQALRLLDLIEDDGSPTRELLGLREAPSNEFQARLGEVVRGAYADVFSFADPATDDPERIEDAFRGYQPHGQRSRMVTLFMGLCEAAGIAEAKRSPRPAKVSTSVQSRTPANRVKPPSAGRPPVTGASRRGTAALPDALIALVNDLPSKAEGWTNDERLRYLDAFRAVLDIYYPIVLEGERRPQGELLPGAQQD